MVQDSLFDEYDGGNGKMFDGVEHGEKQSEGGYFTWVRAMDTLLLQVLRDQKMKGLKDDRNFQVDAYRAAINALNKQFKCNITKEKIVNRLKTLKDIMHLALDALKKSGISWNNTTKKIEARPEVWNELIKAKPKVKRIRDKEIHNLELLRDIYEKDQATETKARTAKERIRQWEETNTVKEVDQFQAENVIIIENLEDPHTSPQLENFNGAASKKILKKSSSKLSVKRKFEGINSEDKKGKNSIDPIQEGSKNVNESIAEIARALYATNARLEKNVNESMAEIARALHAANVRLEKNFNESMAGIARALHAANVRLDKSVIRIFSATEICEELEKHGVPDEKLLAAAKFLKANNEEADIFFGCPDRLKRQWLESNGLLV